MPTDLITQYMPNFLLILLRAGIVLMMLPFFSSRNFPAQYRIGVAVAFAIILAPVVEFHVAKAQIPMVIVREILFGMIFGFAARLIFYAVDVAGHVMSIATGLSAASTFNPDFGPSTVVSQLFGVIAMLLFLAMDYHHDVIAIFIKSYQWLPPGTVSAGGLVTASVAFVAKMFVAGLKLCAPVAIIMLITNILLGFIYKAVPQMNVFFVGQPIYITLGLLTMMIGMPIFAYVVGGYFSHIKDDMGQVILLMKG